MTGWLLILSLLVLGGVLATLGDRLGSKVGKARLSLFNMRPRRTAVLITVLTGSLISALSLGLLLLVSQQLRVGLFKLNTLQTRLKDSRVLLERNREALSTAERESLEAEERAKSMKSELNQLSKDIQSRDTEIQRTEAELIKVRNRIKEGEDELKELEFNLLALRRGAVVVRSGQTLAKATLQLKDPNQSKLMVDRVLQDANLNAFRRVLPDEAPNRQILLVPRSDVERIQSIIRQPGSWVVSLRSATNVLRGERVVYAFPEVRPNRRVTSIGEVLAKIKLEIKDGTPQAINTRLNLLLASAFAEVQRRGSLSEGLQFDANALNKLGSVLQDHPEETVTLRVISIRDSDTADPVLVAVEPYL